MEYSDLRHFLQTLEQRGELLRIRDSVSARLEMTAVGDFALRRGGPALVFESPAGYKIPVLANLFGTTRRVALAMGATLWLQSMPLREMQRTSSPSQRHSSRTPSYLSS